MYNEVYLHNVSQLYNAMALKCLATLTQMASKIGENVCKEKHDVLHAEISENKRLIVELRRIVARYHFRVFVKRMAIKSPERVLRLDVEVLRDDPLVVRVRATLFNGKVVTLELDERDVKMLVKEVVKRKRALIEGVLEQHDARNSSSGTSMEKIRNSTPPITVSSIYS